MEVPARWLRTHLESRKWAAVSLVTVYGLGLGVAMAGFSSTLVDAAVLSLGDKAAHTVAGFLIALPVLIAFARTNKIWWSLVLAVTLLLPWILESPWPGLSMIFDPGDVLANAAGALGAVGLSAACRRVGTIAKPARVRTTPARSHLAASAVVVALFLLGAAATAAALEGTFDMPRGGEAFIPGTGYLAVKAGQFVVWNWTSNGYINFWLEDESSRQFGGSDTSADSGCRYADRDFSVRARWDHRHPDGPEKTVTVTYSLNAVNATAATCAPISRELPAVQAAPWVPVVATLVIAGVVIAILIGVYWTFRKPRRPAMAPKPPTSPPSS